MLYLKCLQEGPNKIFKFSINVLQNWEKIEGIFRDAKLR